MKIILKPEVRNALQKTETAARKAAQATYKQVVRTKVQTECALEQARLHSRIRELQRNIDQQMQNVGELIYATHQGHPSDSDDIQKLLEYTDRLYAEMAEVQKALDGLRQVPCVHVPPKFYADPEAADAPEETSEEPEARESTTAEESSCEDAPKP